MWMALALIQGAAAPLPATVEDDLTCIASIAQSLATADADQRIVLTTGISYFVGRVDGASPTTDIAAAVDRIGRAPGAKAKLDAAALPCARRLLAQTILFARLDPAVKRIERTR